MNDGHGFWPVCVEEKRNIERISHNNGHFVTDGYQSLHVSKERGRLARQHAVCTKINSVRDGIQALEKDLQRCIYLSHVSSVLPVKAAESQLGAVCD